MNFKNMQFLGLINAIYFDYFNSKNKISNI